MRKPTIIDHRRDFTKTQEWNEERVALSQPLHHQALGAAIAREQKPKMTQAEKLAWTLEHFAPAPDRMLVLVDGFDYPGVIVIPKTAQDRPTSGVVVAVGKNESPTDHSILTWKPGDHIVFNVFAGTAIPLSQEFEVRVMTGTEPLCYVKKPGGAEGQVP